RSGSDRGQGPRRLSDHRPRHVSLRRQGSRAIIFNHESVKTRMRFILIVVCVLVALWLIPVPAIPQKPKPAPYGPPATIATIKDKSVSESSGLAASRLTPGAYWTNNDSGDGPFIYAFDTRGDSLGVFRVAGAQARDWEDMAAGPGPQGATYLYLGDIGDNNEARADIVVYRVPEPALTNATRKFTKT